MTIYRLTIADKVRLVRAATRAASVNHVARDTIKAEVAKPEQLVSDLAAGIKVEDAGTAQAEIQTD